MHRQDITYIWPNNCHITLGKNRTLIHDYARRNQYLIPNGYGNTLLDNNFLNSNSFKNSKLFKELLSRDLLIAIPLQDYDSFSPYMANFEIPCVIGNAIIYLGNYSKSLSLVKSVTQTLSDLGCKHLELFCSTQTELTNSGIQNFLDLNEQSIIEAIDIHVDFDNRTNQEKEWFFEKIISNNIVRTVYLYGIENAVLSFKNITYTNRKLNDYLCCGTIHSDYFSNNPTTYTEAQHHNTCLNRKIAIDSAGNIKNCPSMKESYGNIRDTTLLEAIEKPGFKKYWNITKDQTSVCKDCEFRYVCTDCRAYIEDPEDIYSKPLKCGYNPYTCEWEEWSTHPMKQAAIQFYGMEEVVAERQQRLAGKAAKEKNKTED